MSSEAAGGLGLQCMGCGFMCLYGAGITAFVQFLILAFSNDPARVEHWTSTTWTPTTCSIQASGLAYRGTCQNWFGSVEYTDCTEDGGQKQEGSFWNPGKRSVSTACIDHGDRVWDLAHEKGRRLDCENLYVPWVLVVLPDGQKRCSFRWGAEVPSIQHSLSDSQDFLQGFIVGQNTTCYVYPEQDCIVGLQYPMDPMEDWFNGTRAYAYAIWATAVGAAFCCLGAVAVAVGVGISKPYAARSAESRNLVEGSSSE